MKRLLIIFICCFVYTTSFSQEYLNNDIQNLKSESKAFSYSAISTVATILPGIIMSKRNGDVTTASGILLASGYLFAPGLGHLYANNTKEFFSGTGIRLSGVVIFLIGASNLDIGPGGGSSNDDAAAIGILGGMAVGLFGIIHDFATVDNSVREYNSKLDKMSFSLEPIIYNQNDNLTAGLRFKITN